MSTKRPFTKRTAAIAAICAMLDAMAIIAMMMAPSTIPLCGMGWFVAGLELIVIMTLGLLPVLAGLIGIALVVGVPFLRGPKIWVVSTIAVCGIAALLVAVTAAAHPVPSNPSACAL